LNIYLTGNLKNTNYIHAVIAEFICSLVVR